MRLLALSLIAVTLACASDSRSADALPEASPPAGAATVGVLVQDSSIQRGALVAAVANRFAEYQILEAFDIKDVPSEFVAARLTFRSKRADWPYGTIVAVATADTSEVWMSEHHGDYGPHTFSWFDANQDGRTDLMLFGGAEDVAWTSLYTREDSALIFTQVVHDSMQYLTVLDIGADGSIEYLGENVSPSGTRTVDTESCEYYTWPDGIAASAGAALGRARRVPGVRIIDYNLPGAPQFMMHFPKPVAFWRLGSQGLVNVTEEYRGELRWHLDGVEMMRGKQDSPDCNATLDRTAQYLHAIIGQ